MSKLFKLSINDGIKSLITTVLATIVAMLYKFTEAQTFPTTWNDWKTILLAALSAGLAYILKQWLTNNTGEFLKPNK